jgi:hypothetical protein
MGDLSVRGVYRRYIVEPAITFFGTSDPTIVGDPKSFLVRKNVMGGSPGSLRSVLEPLARKEVGPANWHQDVCDKIVGSLWFTQTWTHVDVRIMLDPDPDITPSVLSSVQNTWKAGIEGTWNNPAHTVGGTPQQWKCAKAGEVPCRVSFQVHWVISNPNHVVKVHTGSGQSNETNMYTTDPGNIAAHEFGHMLGLPDEYVDNTNCPGRSPTGTGTIMDSNSNVIPQRLVQWIPDAIGSSLQ